MARDRVLDPEFELGVLRRARNSQGDSRPHLNDVRDLVAADPRAARQAVAPADLQSRQCERSSKSPCDDPGRRIPTVACPGIVCVSRRDERSGLGVAVGAGRIGSRPVSDDRARFEELLRRLGEISDLERISALLGWDEETKMPLLGASGRAEHHATVARVAHELGTAPELGELLEELRGLEEDGEPGSLEASIIRVARREYEKERRVPVDLRAEMSRAASLGYRAWLAARDAGDFEPLRPHLEKRLALIHEYVACHQPYDDPYDVLLDDHEPGMRTADVAAIFERLKAELVPLVAGIKPVDDSCLHGDFAPDRQRAFSLDVLSRWGIDDRSWRLDDTVHPFATALAHGDIRLTARFDRENLSGIFSCLHEFGHGIYERQIDERYARTPLHHGASSGFHESQSRLWENVVGRRLSTWRFFYPRLQDVFPEQLASVRLEQFHRALNRVAPGVVRVDADEVTYPLHIVLRFELEREMLAGDLTPADLPEAFDAKLRAYLGAEPTGVVDGVLQDVHWSDANFGYFPTYALGNVIAVQLWERATSELGDLDREFERGEFGSLRDWLREHVHRWGRVFEPPRLLERVVGTTLDAEPYIAYLRAKVEALESGSVGV
jgi:carboxypeptidase Taq